MSALVSRRSIPYLALALLIGITVISARTSAPVTLDASQILQVNDHILTAYRAAATPIQDVAPVVANRGVNIDGSLRAASTHPMHMAGNPYGSVWSANQTVNGIRLATGSYTTLEVDISLPAEGPGWVIGRTYSSAQNDGSHHDADGYQGKNWFQSSQPEIDLYEHATDDAEDVLYLVYGADRFLEFQRYDSSSTEFKGVCGAAGMFHFEAGAGDDPDVYVFVDQWGWEFRFFGFDADSGSAKGQFWKVTDPEGNESFVGDASLANDPITLGFDQGRITTAFDSEDRRYTYGYTELDGVDRLTEVKAETKTGGTWASPTGLAIVAKTNYQFYGNEQYGDAGDLKMVIVTEYLSDSGVTLEKKQLLRYWEGTFDDTTNPGHPHALKRIVDFEGTRRYDWQDSLFDEDFLTATDLDDYTSVYLEYNSDRQVDLGTFNGGCGGCGGGGGDGTHEYTYGTNGSYTDNTGYDTAWSNRVVIEQPDGTYLTQYLDEAGQSLHQVYTDGDPSSGSPDRWVTEITRNSDGIVTSISTPASVTGYTHSSGAITTSTSAGLVWAYTLETTGDTKSFLLDTKYQEGTSGAAYYLEQREYTTASVTPDTDVTVVRPLVDVEKEYVKQVSASPSATDYNQTDHTPTWYTGSGEELMLDELRTQLPKVTTAKLGSGSRDEEKRSFTKQGRVDWVLRPSGVIDHSDYTGGVLEATIRDAASGDSPPWTADAGAVSRNEDHEYDAQGRRTATTPAGESWKQQSYWSKLADGRRIRLDYPKVVSGTPTYYGPVSFSVTNQAGKVEASGTIGLSSTTTAQTSHIDETDSDPLLAIGIGTVDALTKTVLDETGNEHKETWAYFDIPTSGDGTEGTNYDASYLGYDSMGRLQRRKEAHGTITRYVYDALGRRTETKIGTNDEDEGGADDMVSTEILEYDSGSDDGNGYVTKKTLRVEGTATLERVPTFSHDVRGNVIVVVNPTAPHTLYKRDNLGRVTAVGSYSSSSGLDTSDDPTSLATNRMALTETFYHQRGQVWKTELHEIDPADGSDDNTLKARTWYDAEGRAIMVDGESLTKTVYDRLGRVTHRFTLAKDDDSVYADADDVTGDVVLVEDQTVYESNDSDDVLMRATIKRLHDDEATPTGALDSNADGDDLLITAANLGGRPEITAMWYDDLGRVTDSVTYGNNDTDADGDSDDFDRDGISAPTRSDTKLRTTYAFYDDGDLKSVTDPRDLETRYEYDDAGRQTAVIRNYVDGTPSSSTGDDDVFTRTVYTNGLRTKLWVDFDGDDVEDAGDQVTIYTFGTTKGASAGDSKIGTGHLLWKVQYPDSSGGTDVVTYAYNAQGQEIWRKDQAGNVLEKDYDDSGRLTDDKATTIAGGFDDEVQLITYGYDSLGRRETVTQKDAVTAGNVLDQVKYSHGSGGWGRITKIEQDNNSTVSTGGDNYYQITYDYEKNTTGRNTIRLTEIVLPSGAGYALKYSNTSGKIDDDASRVTSILEGLPPAFQTVLVTYEYLGASQLVGTTYDGEDIKRERFGTTSEIYDALDNFDRVIEDKWVKDLATDVSIYEVDLTYDRNSNITLVDEIGPHVGFDVAYTMDDLDRLTDAQQGTWNGSSITTETSQQTWILDQVGNWEDATLDFNDDNVYTGTDEYDDDRVHNDVNELTSRDIDDDETADYTLAYDAAGNLTDDGESYKYEYDVWYRLRKVNDQSDNLVAEYRYNGLRHRIAEHADTDDDQDVDSNDDWHHFANDERWRVVAMFVDTDTAPTEEFLHHAAGNGGWGRSSYIDEIALRDRDTDANGSLDERIWYLQNWRQDVVALVDDGGDQREMVRYSAYGVSFGLPGGDTDSDGDNDATDITQIQSWIDAPSYDVRGDIDLDGDVDSTDKTLANGSPLSGVSLGSGTLSGLKNGRGYAGYRQGASSAYSVWHVRHRVLGSSLGRWSTRDSLGYVDGLSLYEYVLSSPLNSSDPSGLVCCKPEVVTVQNPISTCAGERWKLLFDPNLGSDQKAFCNSIRCGKDTDWHIGLVVWCKRRTTPPSEGWAQLERCKSNDIDKVEQCQKWHANNTCDLMDKKPEWSLSPNFGTDISLNNGKSETTVFGYKVFTGCNSEQQQILTVIGNDTSCVAQLIITLKCGNCAFPCN